MSFLLKLFFNFFCFLRPFWALSTIFGLCSVLKDDLSKLFSVFVTMGLSEQKIDQLINYIDWIINPKSSNLLFSTTIASPIPMLLWALHLYTPQSVWLTWMMIKRDFERIWWFRVGSCYELLLWHEIQNLKNSFYPGKIIVGSWLWAPNFFRSGHSSYFVAGTTRNVAGTLCVSVTAASYAESTPGSGQIQRLSRRTGHTHWTETWRAWSRWRPGWGPMTLANTPVRQGGMTGTHVRAVQSHALPSVTFMVTPAHTRYIVYIYI